MASTTSKSTILKSNPSLVKAMLDQAGERLPQYKPYIETVSPYVVMAAQAVDTAFPYVVRAWRKGWELWAKAQPYNPQQFVPLLIGLILCFFGGSYLTLVAAVEAVRHSVWKDLWAGLNVLYNNLQKAEEASKKDDEVDADGNGVPDVREIPDKQLLTRKLYLFARVVDPEQVSSSFKLCITALISVIATLRVHFAQAITLGTSLGKIAHQHLSATTLPMIEQALPLELKKWALTTDSFLYSFLGFLFAWFLHRVIAGFHCAMRGAHMFVRSGIVLAKKHGLLEATFEEDSPKASILASIVAFLGFYWQLTNGFSVPFPLNLLLFPLTLCEWLLSVMVGVGFVL